VLDEDKLLANVALLREVQERSGAKILLALKGFAMWSVFPLLSRARGSGPLWGCCASSPHEARLAREEFGGEVHVFAAAFSDEDMREILRYADHVVFNSFAQWRHFKNMRFAAKFFPRQACLMGGAGATAPQRAASPCP
jgi:carboxynorspermidine decarboxylase